MHCKALTSLILTTALTAVVSTANAQALQRKTLGDHYPLSAVENGADPLIWVQRGREAMEALNFELAAQAFCNAARLGDADGQYRLGRLLLQQKSLPRAQRHAHFVLTLAANNGHKDAHRLVLDGLVFEGQSALRPACLPDAVLVAVTAPRPSKQPQAAAEASVAPSLPSWVPASYNPMAGAIDAAEIKRYVSKLSSERQVWAKRLQERALAYGIDPHFAVSIVRFESNFNPHARSPANAHGLMQLIPATAKRFGATDLRDPGQNLEAGLAYLRWLLKRFNHDVLKTTAAYNAGEGAVDRYKGVPPYPETRAYVERIMRFYRATQHKAPALVGPSAPAATPRG